MEDMRVKVFAPPQGVGVLPSGVLTPGTLTVVGGQQLRRQVARFDWTNAHVTGAASTANKITVCTLPAGTIVERVLIVINTAATQAATLTVQAGFTGTTNGYVVASDAKAAANTVYGDADAEIGASLYIAGSTHRVDHLPSWTATTNVIIEFAIGAGTLADVTASTGSVYIIYTLLA